MKALFPLALLFTCLLTLGQNVDTTISMTAQMSGSTTVHDGTVAKIWVFKPNTGEIALPNPSIEVSVDDSVGIRIFNASQMKHTVHLHGLDVDQANDGVESTSQAIGPFGQFTYYFKAHHAGMYFYHCHIESPIHVQLGMYGAVIIRPEDPMTAWTGGPSFDREFNWLLSDLDLSWHDDPPINGNIPDFVPDYFLVNGKSHQQIEEDTLTAITGNAEEKIYVRLGNMGYTINHVIFPAALNAEILLTDGRPMPQSETSDTVVLFPGERYEVMLTPEGPITDSIQVHYTDMYDDDMLGENNIPVTISAAVGLEPEDIPMLSTVYPNPVKTFFNIQDVSCPQIQVTSPTGTQFAVQSSDAGFDASSWPTGTYVIQCGEKRFSLVKE